MRLDIESEDYLQDVAFDYYNEKMAVCSSDRRIRIYKRINNSLLNNIDTGVENDNEVKDKLNNWELSTSWEAHDAPVLKIIFSAPEFGSLLASCGYDKRVIIWQEKIEEGKSIWISKTKFQDFSENVEDISFCNKTFGLKLAVCTVNGKIKIYEPKDYFFYANWICKITKDINICCSSICWNPSALDPQSFVVGSYLSFDNKKFEKEELLKVFVYSDISQDFVCLANINKSIHHEDSITSLEWAPQFGRSYHLIAAGSVDMKVNIFKFEINYDTQQDGFSNVELDDSKISLVLKVVCQNPIQRISFNFSGTILSSIDSKGKVLIFIKQEKFFKQVVDFV